MNPPIESLRDVYERLISASNAERPNEELKSYALTEENARQDARKLADTIAGIANHGYSFGFIVCAGDSPADGAIDGAKLDDLITRFVHPRILVNLHREEIGGRTVDFIIIPKSQLRPHIIRVDDGRYLVPFRGIANNSSAARTELDAIYRERTIETMRAAFPGMTIGESDAVGSYLERIRYGMGVSDEPQLSFAVVPRTIPRRIIENDELFGGPTARNRILNLSTNAINSDYQRHKDWFSASSGLGFDTGEDYTGVVQVGSFESRAREAEVPYYWGARVYNTGTVTYSTVIYPAEFGRVPGAFPLSWFKDLASATLTFAHLVYKDLDLPVDELTVRAILKGAQALRLSESGRLGIPVDGPLIEPVPMLLVPTHEPLSTTRSTLLTDKQGIIEELARILKTKFQMPPVL